MIGAYLLLVLLVAWNALWIVLLSAPVMLTAGGLMVGRTGGRTGPVVGIVGSGLMALLFLIDLVFTLADGGHFYLNAWGAIAAAAVTLSASIQGLVDLNKRTASR